MKIVDTSKSNNCGHGDGKKINAHECTPLIHVVFDSCFSFCLLVATASVTQRDVSFGEDLLMFRSFAPFFPYIWCSVGHPPPPPHQWVWVASIVWFFWSPPPVACGGGMVLLVPPLWPVVVVCWYVGMLVCWYVGM